MNKFYVYKYIRSKNSKHGPAGSPYYIGKGCGKRAWSIKGHRIKPPVNTDNIIFISTGISNEEALCLEKSLIKQYGRIDLGTGCLWNMTDGGDNPPGMKGKHHSAKSKTKMRAAKLGKKTGPHSAEWNANISKSQTGKVVSPETCALISKNHNHPKNLYTPEWCEKVSKSKIGKKRPDMLSGSEHQKKCAASNKGGKRSPETILKMREAAKKREAKKRNKT
jgi:hypothetical protein